MFFKVACNSCSLIPSLSSFSFSSLISFCLLLFASWLSLYAFSILSLSLISSDSILLSFSSYSVKNDSFALFSLLST